MSAGRNYLGMSQQEKDRALYDAVVHRSRRETFELLRMSADINALGTWQRRHRRTPVHELAFSMVQAIDKLRPGSDYEGQIAVVGSSSELLCELLKNPKVNLHVKGEDGYSTKTCLAGLFHKIDNGLMVPDELKGNIRELKEDIAHKNLLYAARFGDIVNVKRAFESGANINAVGANGFTALHSAAFALKTGQHRRELNNIPFTIDDQHRYVNVICELIEMGSNLVLSKEYQGRHFRTIDTLIRVLQESRLEPELYSRLRDVLLKTRYADEVMQATIEVVQPSTVVANVANTAAESAVAPRAQAAVGVPVAKRRHNPYWYVGCQTQDPVEHENQGSGQRDGQNGYVRQQPMAPGWLSSYWTSQVAQRKMPSGRVSGF